MWLATVASGALRFGSVTALATDPSGKVAT